MRAPAVQIDEISRILGRVAPTCRTERVVNRVVVRAALPQSWMVPAATFREHVAFLFYLRGAVDIILHAGINANPGRSIISSSYVALCRVATALILNYPELSGLLELAEWLDRVVELVMT